MNSINDGTAYISINHPDFGRPGVEQLEVYAGQRLSTIKVVQNQNIRPNLVRINDSAAKALWLPANLQLEYRILNRNPASIKVGPVVGILTTVKQSVQSGLPVGKEAAYFAELVSYARKKGVFIYLFYASGINWISRSVSGYTINPVRRSANKWVEGEYPLPDIVYNRIRSRRIEKSSVVLELLKRLEDNGIHLFNTQFLDKWDVYNILRKNVRLITLLPPTALFNYDNMLSFLRKYPELFLKPRDSSVGKGIIKIKKTANGYSFALARSGKPIWHRRSSPEALYEAIVAVIPDKSRYLVQRGIDLAKINNSVFDLRVQVQKNGEGNWTLTGVGVRAAAPEHFVTHIPNGGSAQPYKEVIERRFGYSINIKRAIQKQFRTIITETPAALESISGLKLAVLAIDIGIDQQGKMWIIEVNSKPSSFDEPDIRQAHLKYFTDYCKYLFSVG
jgi:hypothetical protein